MESATTEMVFGKLLEILLDVAAWQVQRALLGRAEEKFDTDNVVLHAMYRGTPGEDFLVLGIIVDEGRNFWCRLALGSCSIGWLGSHVEPSVRVTRRTWPVYNGSDFCVSLIRKTAGNVREGSSEIESHDELLVRVVWSMITCPHLLNFTGQIRCGKTEMMGWEEEMFSSDTNVARRIARRRRTLDEIDLSDTSST